VPDGSEHPVGLHLRLVPDEGHGMDHAQRHETETVLAADRRIGSRLPALGVPAGRLCWPGETDVRSAPCWLLDVSITGCALLTAADPGLGPGVLLQLVVDDLGISCAVEVRRIGMWDMGCLQLVGVEFADTFPQAVEIYGTIADVLQGRTEWLWVSDRAPSADAPSEG
jgi:hypothetical protein